MLHLPDLAGLIEGVYVKSMRHLLQSVDTTTVANRNYFVFVLLEHHKCPHPK